MLATEKLKRPLGHSVNTELTLRAIAVPTIQVGTLSSFTIRRAAAERGQRIIPSAVHVIHSHLQLPVVDQALFKCCEGVQGVLLTIAPARTRVGGA
ncbi:hypothetical protein D3C79_915940 [compost metagenome]